MPQTYKFRKAATPVKQTCRPAEFDGKVSNDCAVLALAACTGVPYPDALKFCAGRLAFKPSDGTSVDYLRYIAASCECVYGFRVFARRSPVTHNRDFVSVDSYGYRDYHTREQYQTLTQFVKTHPKGRFLCSSRIHSCAVIDGVIYDNGAASPRSQVHGWFYEFIESSKVEAAGMQNSSMVDESRLAAIR